MYIYIEVSFIVFTFYKLSVLSQLCIKRLKITVKSTIFNLCYRMVGPYLSCDIGGWSLFIM
jgi:hypothetical protein